MNGFPHYTTAAIITLAYFAFVTSITPGPNNIMLLHSGARFGFKKTLPHWMGINIGFTVMVVLCCLGVASLLFRVPAAQTVLKILGCAYMLWLAYKLWVGGALPSEATMQNATATEKAQPLTFTQAALFQYVNPKAWMMGLTVPSTFLPHTGPVLSNTMVAALVFGMINLACMSVWVQGGVALKALMHKPVLAKIINLLIVLMTVYCAVSVWF